MFSGLVEEQNAPTFLLRLQRNGEPSNACPNHHDI